MAPRKKKTDPEPQVATTQVQGEYLRLDDYIGEIKHNLMRPTVNGSSPLLEERKDATIFDFDTKQMVRVTYVTSDLIGQLHAECITNASDSIEKSIESGIDPGRIEVHYDQYNVRIKNYGIGIRVTRDMNDKDQLWWPTILFSRFRSGSNLDDSKTRTVAGVNGIGCKLIVIFSIRFTVRIVDAINGLYFEQTFTNNMMTHGEPIVTPLVIDPVTGTYPPSSVEVEYTLDFDRLNIPHYSREILGSYARTALEVAMNNNIPIVINDIEFPPMTIEAYARMYYPESNLWSYENKETRSRVCLVDAPNSAMALGYVNGLFIPRGGTHIIAVYEEALRIIESTGLVAKKKRKGKEPDKDDKSKADKTDKAKEADLSLNIGDLERNMAVFISVRIDKPLFTSQAKERLKSKIEIPLPDSGIHSFTKAVKDWYLIKQLQVVLEAKDLIRLKSTDGIKTKRVHIKRLEDANLAGTNKSGQCFLCLVEGDSAEAYISKLRGYIQDGSDTIGIGKLRGKPLNVTSCTIDQLVTNEEIHMIKKALGLREGVDYTDPTNFATLRYGRILVCTDADTDGTHIKGLILLLLTLYPSLFAIPFVYSWESPAVISTKGSEVKLFYRFVEYEHWTETNDTKGWTNRYMKGLGTSDDSDIMRDTRIFKNTRHVIDEGGLERLQSVFDEDAAEMRKDWIKNWKPTTFEAPDQVQTLSDFVDNDLILYARATLPRALPSIVDGMKSVQRKVLYGGILEAPHNKEPMVVSRLAGRIAERTAYHHGPSSIEECIERMGVDHPGTNNMPLVMRHGQFGNRKSNRLVAARYPRAKMAWWISSVFRREDDNILVGQTEDGEPIEPAYFIPIIPTLLLNGTRAGVAVAWSTCIPAHHPLRIVEWIKAYLNGDTPTPLQPWYRGYTGNIEIKPNCYVSQGRFEQVGNKVIIRELPLFRLYETYEEFLDELIKTEVIRDYDTKCTDEQPCYILSGMKETPTLHNLRLQRNHSTTNMTVLGVDGVPIQFRSTDEIMYHFCQIRYEAYQRRKVYQLTELDKELAYLRLKLAYLQDVAAGNLIVIKRKNAELNADMAARGYPKTLLNLKGHSFTDDGITNARNEIVKTEEKIRHLTATDVKDIWLGELDEFVAAYHKHYKE